MSDGERDHQLRLLTDSYSDMREMIEGIDLELCVYSDTGWRIRDIIGHIATWERQVVNSLRAFQAGTEYSIPNFDEHSFNENAVAQQRVLTAQEVLSEWELARKDLISVLQGLPPDLYPGDLLYPWGDERGSITRVAKFMIDHDAEHRDEIMNAIQVANED